MTLNIEGEGEVLEEIVNAGRTTDYDSGTTVKLTAVPAEGWEFAGWTGAIESTELEVQLLVSEAKEVNAEFRSIDKISLVKTDLKSNYNNLNDVLVENDNGLTLGMLNFKSGNIEHLIFSACRGRECEVFKLPTFHYTRIDNSDWVESNIFYDVNMTYCGKDVVKIGNKDEYIWVDTGQETFMAGCPENQPWGTIYLAKNFTENSIDWELIDSLSFFHDIFIDDIDGDGDKDFVITVLDSAVINEGIHVYINNEGHYERQENFFVFDGKYFLDGNNPFVDCLNDSDYIANYGAIMCPSYSIGGVAIADLDGDGGKEIIASSYKVLPNWSTPEANKTFEIYSDKNKDGLFELFKVIPPIGVKENPYAGIVETYPEDIDNDGDLDLIVFFENNTVNGVFSNQIPNNGIQIFINDGNANFSYSGQQFSGEFPVWAAFSKFSLIDYDHDGDMDIIGDSQMFPEYQITNLASINSNESQELIIDFDKFIWTNENGTFIKKENGFKYSFNYADNPNLVYELGSVKPYFIDNKLKFVVLRDYDNKMELLEFYINN